MLVALYLYCRIPFGRMHSGNPEIVKSAGLIGRTPSAVAMKLTNIASLDPAITATGRKGLANASATDKAMWEEMQADWPRFAVEAQQAASALGVAAPLEAEVDEPDEIEDVADYAGTEKEIAATIRVGQHLFRSAVLSAYDQRCCITGLSVPALLVASHIVPWKVDVKNRLNPRNGLCLSVLHDKSFDAGIITISEDMTVRVSSEHTLLEDDFFQSALSSYHGRPIAMPEKFPPAEEFLSYHRQHVFQG